MRRFIVAALAALTLAGTATAATAPDVPTAIAKLTASLDSYYHGSKKTGGLGYSVARAQQTNVYQALVALGGSWPTVAPPPSPPPTGTDCFAAPGACGYPDPNFHNVGVPQGVTLKASGGFATTSNGQVINGLKVTGTITVNNSNVTIENTEIVTSGGGGAQAIHVAKGVTGLLIVDSTLHGVDPSPAGAMETGLFNLSGAGSVTAERVWIYNCTECWQYNGTIQDSYLNDNGSTAAGAHDEAVYNSDGTNMLSHDTLLNPNMQTAVFFGDTGGGCFCKAADNHTTITNSLLAGGGWTIYAASGSNCTGCGVGSSTLVVTNNRFARCGTAYVFNSQTGGGSCSGGQDKFGYWPGGGYFGVLANAYCGLPGQVWVGNVWDDSGAVILC